MAHFHFQPTDPTSGYAEGDVRLRILQSTKRLRSPEPAAPSAVVGPPLSCWHRCVPVPALPSLRSSRRRNGCLSHGSQPSPRRFPIRRSQCPGQSRPERPILQRDERSRDSLRDHLNGSRNRRSRARRLRDGQQAISCSHTRRGRRQERCASVSLLPLPWGSVLPRRRLSPAWHGSLSSCSKEAAGKPLRCAPSWPAQL